MIHRVSKRLKLQATEYTKKKSGEITSDRRRIFMALLKHKIA